MGAGRGSPASGVRSPSTKRVPWGGRRAMNGAVSLTSPEASVLMRQWRWWVAFQVWSFRPSMPGGEGEK